MKYLTTIIFLAICVLNTFVSSSSIEMKILVISTSKPVSVIQTLQSYNIPYEYQEYNSEKLLQGNLELYDEQNNPKYSGIIISNGQLSVQFENGSWGSVFSTEQWEYLYEYERKNNIRCVNLDDGPNALHGTEIFSTSIWGTSETQTLKVADNEKAKAIFTEAGVKLDASLDSTGLYHTPVKIIDSSIAVPFLNFEPNSIFTEESVAAVLIKTADNREILSFYLSFGEWSINSVMINHLWISWITRSLYSGNRQILFTPHIDDVFISTGKVDMINNSIESTDDYYRSTTEDFDILAKWQKDISAKLPEGSFIQSELAFNGNGILAAIDYDYVIDIDGERHVDLEYKKAPGTGVSRWPMANYNLPYDATLLSKDSLFSYFSEEEKRSEFFWSSHTYTHENLDDATTTDVENEIKTNIDMAKLLGVHDKPYWSGESIITPQISGLRNVDAINVMKKYGIIHGTGDLSRPTIVNQENPYYPWYTTMESSNYDGFPVIPRSPTEVYYSSSTTEENAFIYNTIYESILGKSSWDDIVKREADRVFLLLMKLRGEAYQFHQINIRSHDIAEKESILQKWGNAILEKYSSYVDWPVRSLKLDDLARTFIEKYDLNEYCDISRSMIFNGKYITDIEIKPKSIKKDCRVPITVPGDAYTAEENDRITYEQIGKDRLTVWIEFKEGETNSQLISLNPPLLWSTEETDPTTPKCWSEPYYVCCKEDENIVEYIDESGWWGITKGEEPQWCGVTKSESCWADVFGLPCCENDTPEYIHEGNVLGYEFKYENDPSRPAGGWCGLPGATEIVNQNAKELFEEQLKL